MAGPGACQGEDEGAAMGSRRELAWRVLAADGAFDAVLAGHTASLNKSVSIGNSEALA